MSNRGIRYIRADLQKDPKGQLFVKANLDVLDVLDQIDADREYFSNFNNMVGPDLLKVNGFSFMPKRDNASAKENAYTYNRPGRMGTRDRAPTAPDTISNDEQMNSEYRSELEEGIQISQQGRQFIEREEGFESHAYRVGGEGNWTIGYGHEFLPGESFPSGITQKRASRMLTQDLKRMKNTSLDRFLNQNEIQLNQHQYDALLSFTYNMGENIWDAKLMEKEGESMRDLFISGKYQDPVEVEKVFSLFQNRGLLLERRQREAKLFNTGKYSDAE